MSEFIGTAKVRIVPDIKGFQALLRTEVRKAIEAVGPQPVTIVPQLAPGSIAKIRADIRAAIVASGVHPVPITPQVTAFQKDLQRQLKNTPVQVPVTPAPSAGRAVGGATGAAAGQAASGTIKQGAAAQKASAQEQALTRAITERDAATRAFNKAQATGLTITERHNLLQKSSQSITAAVTKLEESLAIGFGKSGAALRAKTQATLTQIQSDQKLIASEARLAEVEFIAAEAIDKGSLALTKSATLGQTRSALREQDNALKAAEAELEIALAEATNIGNAAREKSIIAMREEIAIRRGVIEGEIANIASSRTLAQQQATALRGATSTGASLLGVRGATLAASNAFLAGAVAVAIFAKAVQSAANLETELNVFQVTAGATADQMERVSAVAQELGADLTLPTVSAGDAAASFTNLAKAGLSVEDSVSGARGVLQLATAAQIENAEATELVASALNAFSLGGKEATTVADLLTGASIEAQGSISDMGIALQQSSAVARQAGVSLEDTVSFITLLARAGIRGSDAGTSLRTALLRLIAPTETAEKELKQLGITVLDAAGNVRPEVFSELQTALSGLGAQARNQVLRKIFGQDAIRAAVIFGREGAVGLNEVRDAISESGLAAELAEARTKGFAGQIEGLKNSIETLGVSLGQTLIPVAGSIVDSLNEIVTAARDVSTALGEIKSSVPGGDLIGDFLGKIPLTGGKTIREFRALIDLGTRSQDTFTLPTNQVSAFNKELSESIHTAGGLAKELDKARNLEEAIDIIEQFRGKIIGTGEDAKVIGLELDEISNVIRALGSVPTFVDLRTILEEGSIEEDLAELLRKLGLNPIKLKVELERSSRALFLAETQFLADDAKAIWETMFSNITTTPDPEKAPPPSVVFQKPGQAQGLTPEQITNRLLGFDERVTRAQLQNNVRAELQALQELQAFINQQLARPKIATAGSGPLKEARIALQQAGEQVQNDIEGIQEDRRQSTEEAANNIKKAQAEQANQLLKIFGRQEQKAINRITLAAQTERVSDDLKFQKQLLALIKKQQAVAQKKIKDLAALADFMERTNQQIFDINQEINDLEKEQIERTKQLQEEHREQVRKSLELDIEFFSITEQPKKEIAARKRRIKALQQEINLIKKQGKLTLEKRNRIRELQIEQAREREAIEDLKKEQDETNNSMKELFFSFLQAQQGFAANLLGNLIPGNVTGLSSGRPTVSGPSGTGGGALSTGPGAGGPGAASFGGGLGGALIAEAGLAAAGKAKGPSSGQLSELIEINRGILRMLARIAGDAKHPEAKRSRISNRTALDLHGPGV